MAGIGFVLRRLQQKDTLSGSFQGFLHAAVVSSGPWLMTVLALAAVYVATRNVTFLEDVSDFRNIVMYNFCFSAVFSAPIVMVSTRFLSDCIYRSDLRQAPGMLVGSLTILYAIAGPVAFAFYFGVSKLPGIESLLAVMHFLLVCTTSVVSVFLSALKNYRGISASFLIGLGLSVVGSIVLSNRYEVTGMLVGFSFGFVFIVGAVISQIMGEYPRDCRNVFQILSYFPRYWDVALTAFFYVLGTWVDKWIMWFSPQAIETSAGLVMYPPYDSAMFLAFLTMVPALAVFVLNSETSFFELYLKFYRGILGHRSYKVIQKNHGDLMRGLADISRAILLLQTFVCVATLVLAPKLFEVLGLSLAGIGMFRYGVLGVTFHVFHLFICVFLSYFDHRKGSMTVATVFFVMNTVFTLGTLVLGFPFYGYGYFLSSLTTFVVAAIILERYVSKLTFQTFVVNNSALRD